MQELEKWQLLAVDDEPVNLEIIREYLDDPRFELRFAQDAEQAMACLLAPAAKTDLVILDRMMPGVDGIELLRRMKSDPRFRHIPVIMQTAAAAPAQVLEGIEAGAHYYLTKPYLPETLRAIVCSALGDLAAQRQAARIARAQAGVLHLIARGEFRFRTLEQALGLAGLLASLCPAPEMAAMGLSELMVNAVEHGNLGIDYAEKSRLKREDRWEAEIAHRLDLPECRGRQATVTLERRPGCLAFTIADEGAGFDWRAFMDFSPARAFDPNGRGIAMARQLSFDSVEYLGCGNVVTATVALNPEARPTL